MMYQMKEQHFENVINLPEHERYIYLIKRAADREVLYSLEDPKGWFLAADDDGVEFFPMWPHPRFAELCATGQWDGGKVAEFSINEWFQKIQSQLIGKQIQVVAFPSQNGSGVTVTAERFSNDLRDELSKIEDVDEENGETWGQTGGVNP